MTVRYMNYSTLVAYDKKRVPPGNKFGQQHWAIWTFPPTPQCYDCDPWVHSRVPIVLVVDY